MVCKCCIKFLLFILVPFLLTVAFLPDTEKFFGFDVQIGENPKLNLPESFSGPLLANRYLNEADRLFENEILGPEAFAEFNGEIYAPSLLDSRIVQLLPDSYRTVTRFDPDNLGPDCAKLQNIDRCGHPVGVRFDSRGLLYTALATQGLYSVNVSTGETKVVASASQLDQSSFLNDLVIVEKANGVDKVIYTTESTHKWKYPDMGPPVAEHDTTGRLLAWDTETQKVRIELDQLPVPNGLALTRDQTALLMAVSADRLIYKYFIAGPKKGKLEVLVENLPGEPDQIKPTRDPKQETFWVGIFTARNQHKPHPMADVFLIQAPPTLIRFIFRLQRSVGYAIESVGRLVRSDTLLELGLDIKHGYTQGKKACQYGMAIEIDLEGQILDSMHSPDGSYCNLSEVFELEDQGDDLRRFYLGSPVNPFVGKLVLPKSAFRKSDPMKISSRNQVPKDQKSTKSDSIKAQQKQKVEL